MVFLFYLRKGQPRAAGTAFLCGYPIGDEGNVLSVSVGTAVSFEAVGGYGGIVTARHVIDGIKEHSDDGKAYIRLNRRNGGLATVTTDVSDWIPHADGPIADVAVLPWLPFLQDFDHLVTYAGHALTDEIIRRESIDTGDELFLPGLFVNHHGAEQNIPIVRVGNIAAMPGEPVQTDLGPMTAYLIEARSIGGLSGSPVFVHLGWIRHTQHPGPYTFGRLVVYLLGVMHGHWDTVIHPLGNEMVNMGIAIVTPISKVLDVFESREEFQEMEKSAREQSGQLPTPDIAIEEPVERESWGPSEFDRFEDLTRKLVNTPKEEVDKQREDES